MTRKIKFPAVGSPKGIWRRAIVSFDDETFGQVREMALNKRVSLSEAVRQLVEIGLEELQ